MTTPELELLKFPIGQFEKPIVIDKNQVTQWIETIENFPIALKTEVEHLSFDELQKKYRPNGWTINQVVNHCADSHINSFIRFKLALTEDTPIIRPYYEDKWAELSDAKTFPIQSAIDMLTGTHSRWIHLLKNLSEQELQKEFIHPESNERIDLKTNIGIYAWHCKHHLQHIINAKKSDF